MAIALAIFSIIFVAVSMYGVLLPQKLVKLVRGIMSKETGLWVAVAARLLLAALLWFTASASYTPALFQGLAALFLLAAIVLPIIGRPRLNRIIEYFAAWPPWAIRLPCLGGIAMGAFLLWSISSAIGAV